jgi:tetratricopeptide (TPR) repeat protein
MRAADLMPGNFEAAALAARLILALGRYDDSLAITSKLLVEHPGDVDLLVLWGTAAAGLNNPYYGLFNLGPTGGRGEDYERACTVLRPIISENRERSAEDALRRALRDAPTHFEARFALAGFLWATRRADESEDLIRGLADEFPQHTMINDAVGRFYLARGRDADAEKYLENAAAAKTPDARAPRLVLADHYLATKRFSDVLVLLDGLTGDDDENGAVTLRRADAMLGLGQADEAVQVLDAFIAQYPLSTTAWVLKARALLDEGDAMGGTSAAERAVKSDPTSAEARVVLARGYEALDDPDLAYREYAEAQRLNPTMPGLAEPMAVLGLRTGRYRAALAAARQAAERAPNDRDVRRALVEALVRSGRAAEAEGRLAPLLKATPLPPRVQLLRGLVHAARGRDADARADLEAALRAAPAAMDALAALVELDLAHGQIDTARQRVESALATRPGHVTLLRLRGHVQRAAGDLNGAEATFREALAARPTDTDAALLLAHCLADRRQPAEAQRILEQVLRRRPSSLAAQTAMAGVLEALGRLDEAQERYESILAEYPDAIDAASRLAVLLVTRGRSANVARHVLGEALRVAPGDPRVSDAYGWVQLHREQVPAALQFLQSATRQEPDNPTYLYHLGVAYSRAGQAALARDAFTRALRLGTAFPDRARVEDELERLPR